MVRSRAGDRGADPVQDTNWPQAYAIIVANPDGYGVGKDISVYTMPNKLEAERFVEILNEKLLAKNLAPFFTAWVQ